MIRKQHLAITTAVSLLLPGVLAGQAIDTLRVRVHDHEMVLYRTGTTGPVVILEAGGGSSHRVWDNLVPLLARHAQVITYDRPGYGLSAPCGSPRTAIRIAQELHEAVTAAGITMPHYMGGWSLGGAIARVYAGEFPESVTGLLLIDPAPEEFYSRAPREHPDDWTMEEEGYFPSLYADSSKRTEQRELAGYAASMEQARLSDAKHRIKTTLLIAARDAKGSPDPISRIWIDELQHWAARRPATTALVVPRVGHHIARENPDAVTEAFLGMVNGEGSPPGLDALRAATGPYADLDAAVAAGYTRDVPACLVHEHHGAMGYHHTNSQFMDATIDLARPEILLYERMDDGAYRLNGVEFIVPYRAWPRDSTPPVVMGQVMLPEDNLNFWYRHVWAWKPNPDGLFANFHPDVRCPEAARRIFRPSDSLTPSAERRQ